MHVTMHRQGSQRAALSLARCALGSLAAMAALLLVGCANGPLRSGGSWPSSERDGAEANPPPDLARVPDAEPRLEPIRSGGPNKPYDALGRTYTPITQDAPYTERGLASWYGKKFHGRKTASGEVYNMYAMTAAHPTLPIPSYARIRNPANAREVVVRINDRGPFHAGRILDLSYTAALKLDLLRGVGPVEVQRITFDDIRTGAWRRGPGGDAVRVAALSVVPVAAGVADTSVDSTSNAAASSTVPAPRTISAPADASLANLTAASGSGSGSGSVNGSATATESNAASASALVATPAAVRSAALPTAPAPSAASVEPVAEAPTSRAYTSAARGFWVQLGVFRARDGAESFHKRVSDDLDWLSPLLAVFNDASMFRLQAGPYPSREEARGVAQRVREGLQLVPVIVERR